MCRARHHHLQQRYQRLRALLLDLATARPRRARKQRRRLANQHSAQSHDGELSLGVIVLDLVLVVVIGLASGGRSRGAGERLRGAAHGIEHGKEYFGRHVRQARAEVAAAARARVAVDVHVFGGLEVERRATEFKGEARLLGRSSAAGRAARVAGHQIVLLHAAEQVREARRLGEHAEREALRRGQRDPLTRALKDGDAVRRRRFGGRCACG